MPRTQTLIMSLHSSANPYTGSKFSQRRHLDQLFVLVNAGHHAAREADKHNKQRALNRQEFISLLVRIGIIKYIEMPPRRRQDE